MKLSDYAKQQGVRYETAWRWFRDGKIKGRRVGAHTILIEEERPSPGASEGQVAVYTRVSSSENKSNLDSQAERLVAYCAVRGYQVSKVVKEIGSGVNDNRPKFLALLADPAITKIVVEHKDRGTRFGFRYIETLLHTSGREIEVVNQAENSTEDLLADLTSIFYSISRSIVWATTSQTKNGENCPGIGGQGCNWLKSISSSERIRVMQSLTRPVLPPRTCIMPHCMRIRQAFIQHGEYLNYSVMDKRMQNHEAYKALPAKVAQQVLILLEKNWKSFFEANAAYKEDPSRFRRHPQLPKYKHKTEGRNVLVYTMQAVSRGKRTLSRRIIQPSGLPIQVKTQQDPSRIAQVRIIPKPGFFVVEVIYEQDPQRTAVDPYLIAGIDPGLNNVVALTRKQTGLCPGRSSRARHQIHQSIL